mmetsp:Transcript_3567/g.5395  ORF Transcript_3567/g.5395 Transcript_3567/m.5395 type:complete len:139 (-) Transcript_3567:15-431(-)
MDTVNVSLDTDSFDEDDTSTVENASQMDTVNVSVNDDTTSVDPHDPDHTATSDDTMTDEDGESTNEMVDTTTDDVNDTSSVSTDSVDDTTATQSQPRATTQHCVNANCRNLCAVDCDNQSCGRCCLLYGRYSCDRHST